MAYAQQEFDNSESVRGKRVSPYSADAICAVRIALSQHYGFDYVPTVEEFCMSIINTHIEDFIGDDFNVAVTYDLPQLMLTSSNYSICVQHLDMINDEELYEYATSRGGSWIYMDAIYWNGRTPTTEQAYESDYITFRQMLDTLELMNQLNRISSDFVSN